MTRWGFVTYVSGLVTMGYLACGLFFAKFWWRSRDLLFLAFAIAFWFMAADATLLAALAPQDQRRLWVYLLRIPAYLLIVLAIVRKNTNVAREE
jgi:Family of unknown function (DUF5985)